MFKAIRYMILTIIVTVGAPLLVWGGGFAIFVGAMSYLASDHPAGQVDAAIVLTGGSNRVNQGFDLLAAGKVRYLLVSGVHSGVKLNELVTLWNGNSARINAANVTLGREADNTIGNAIEAAHWMKDHDIREAYLITSTYHMPRALLEFRHEMKNLTLVPYAVEPSDFSSETDLYWKTAFLEYNKLLVSLYRVVIHPREKQPIPPSLAPPSREGH